MPGPSPVCPTVRPVTTTPPGWYPDPEQTGDGPVRELWWDGAAWTGRSRARGAARGPVVAGIVGAVVLAASLIVGAVLFAGLGRAGGPNPGAGPSAPAPENGPASPDPTGPPPSAPVGGVALPALPGWHRDAGATFSGTVPYTCPGEGGGECYRGAAVLVPAWPVAGSGNARPSPRKAAAQDIRRNADSAYGGITGHEVLTSEETTVAGRPAHRIRWRTESRTGPDGYVESVAFAHPDGSGNLLVLRISVDVHPDSPPLADMDRLTAGVRGTAAADDVART